MIKVAVLGAAGRMGRTVVDAVTAAPDLELVATVDEGDSLDSVAAADVAVDFTVPAVTAANVHALIDLGLNVVVGTTGWTPSKLAAVATALEHRPEQGVLIAPNFALGAVLTMQFAKMAAPLFESVEVIELHHPDKVDAPSGTAIHTANAIAAARAASGAAEIPDATVDFSNSARGADINGVRVHAVRARGFLAHEEVLLGNPGEVLTIRHDSLDRVSFMPGVLLGIREVVKRPGLTVGLENYLEL